MDEQLFFTRFLNKILAGPANALLNAVHINDAWSGLNAPGVNPDAPISNAFAMELLVFLFLIAAFLIIRSKLSVESPGGVQHFTEMIHEFVSEQAHDIIGHGEAAFVPFLSTLFIFILFANLIGLLPGFESPTQEPWVPLGLAVATFFYYHAHGIYKQGIFRYLAHFAGPMPAMAWLMFPIEVVSNFARLLSLTARLYANMFAGEMVTMVFFSMIPIGIPVLFLILHFFVSGLQAYIFMLLATIYIAGAVAEGH